MSNRKRSIDSVDEDESDIAEESSSRTSLSSQSAPNKRRRTIDEREIRQDIHSDDDRYSGFDSQEEDEYEQMTTQAIRQQHAADKDNVAAECGILEQVHVENFMNHENFEFNLGPLINFVCGKNGSGKSAILTALTLCLGGKASSTNRGASLKSFIKEGKETAVITVRLKNQGDGAYMPDEFGETIQVVRQFSRSGTSGFKVKSKTGRIISTKKADLEEICDHFALQMDNPMNVLSQDMARQFISTSNAAEKYKFFVKGVQLEQLDQDYRIIEENLDNIEAKLETNKPDIDRLEKKMEKAKARLALSERHDTIRDRLRDYRRQLAWAQVEARERLHDECVEAVRGTDEKIADAESKVQEWDQKYQDSDQAATEAAAAHEQAKGEKARVEAEKDASKEKQNVVAKDVQEMQRQQRDIRSALVTDKETIKKKKSAIAEEEQRLADLNGGGTAARLAELEDANQAAGTAHEDYETHESQRIRLGEEVDQTQTSADREKTAIAPKRAEVERRVADVEKLAQSNGQQDAAYDPRLPDLLRAIQRETSFARRPIGPIGKHVRLTRPEWSSVLEKSFGQTLNGFIVTTKGDMDILNRLKERTRCAKNIPVFISNAQLFDTTPHEPDREFLTVMRAMTIDNELVRKQLVLQHGIEKSILIADVDEASQVLYAGDRPRNVQRCYCIAPHDKRKGIHLSYTRNGEGSQDPIDEYRGAPRMATDMDAQIQMAREALQESRQELNELESQSRTCQTAHTAAKQALVRHKRRAEELKIKYQEADDRVEAIQNAISDENVENGKLDELKKQLEDAEGSKSMNEGSFEDCQIAYDAKRELLRIAKAELEAFDARIEELQISSNKAEAEAQNASKKRSKALGDKNDAINKIGDARQDRANLQQQSDRAAHVLQQMTEQASEICARVNVSDGETPDTLRAKYDKLNRDLHRHQQELGATREELAAEFTRSQKSHKDALRQYRDLENLAWTLKRSLVERRERWKKFRSFISCRARAQFTYLLSERSFRGRLIMDHRQKMLELSVEPDITKRDGVGRGAKTLSGGEKSFSQICLLLSIWEAMGSPIRCLDEFDVYMDAVNRKMSIDMLIGAAQQSVGRQFVLISPGTKQDIKRMPDVHTTEYVLAYLLLRSHWKLLLTCASRLAPPDRGQAQLAF